MFGWEVKFRAVEVDTLDLTNWKCGDTHLIH
jgi:hypothetical protein